MSDLKTFVSLQARLYEFLEQQDEPTLRAIANGMAKLAVLPTGDSQPVSTDLTVAPSDDTHRAAQDLPKLLSEHERRVYLNSTGLTVKELKRVAHLLGLKRYSGLARTRLIDLLACYDQNDDSVHDERVTAASPRPSPTAASTETAKVTVDVAAIASRLRELETEEEGAAYLQAQHLNRESLLAVAAELRLTRVERLKPSELEKRVLKQAIGARRKFAGLRKW